MNRKTLITVAAVVVGLVPLIALMIWGLESVQRTGPDMADPEVDRLIDEAIASLQEGELDWAENSCAEALRKAPESARAHSTMAVIAAKLEEPDRALAHFRQAAELLPDDADVQLNYGVALIAAGRLNAARTYIERAAELEPESAAPRFQMGNLESDMGQMDRAIALYAEAAELDPNHMGTQENLARAYVRRGDPGRAVPHFKRVLELDEGRLQTAAKLAWLLATCPVDSVRNGEDALTYSWHAAQKTGFRNPQALEVLAAAYAETGDFQMATAYATMARDLCVEAGRPEMAQRMERRLALFAAERPIREDPDSAAADGAP